MVKVFTPGLVEAGVFTRTMSSLPVSLDTTALVPAALLVILGWPWKPEPMMITLTAWPTRARPCTLPTWNGAGFLGGGGGVAAGRITIEAVPPSGFFTSMFDAVVSRTPNVHDTVSEV